MLNSNEVQTTRKPLSTKLNVRRCPQSFKQSFILFSSYFIHSYFNSNTAVIFSLCSIQLFPYILKWIKINQNTLPIRSFITFSRAHISPAISIRLSLARTHLLSVTFSSLGFLLCYGLLSLNSLRKSRGNVCKNYNFITN